MQLQYRGQSYVPCHTAERKPQKNSLQFLGQSYQVSASHQPATVKPQPKFTLQFLGRSYAMA